MAAAAADQPLGFFSGVWSRLRAAASGWCRRDDPADEIEEEEATARSRLARRRLGRKLAFVSFNLEVLVFVYAFWRTRRRNFSWRQPTQALPMLVIPTLATLIYAAFIRFTRTLDLKDKKLIERLQEKKQASDCVLRELDQDEQERSEKYDLTDDPSNFSTAAASAETSEFGTSQKPIINLRNDGGGDISWDHSKDFQPTCTDALRRRGLSTEKAYMTSSNAVLQPIGWSTEHLADDPEELDYKQLNVGHHCYLGNEVAKNSMVYSRAETGTCLPDCSIVDINSNGMNHAECSPPPSSLKFNGGLAEENPLQKGLIRPKSDLSAFGELLDEGLQENKSSKFHVSEEDGVPSVSKKEHFMDSYAVENKEQHLETSSGLALCSQDTDKEDVAGGVCFVNVSPESTFLSSTELVVECSKDASNKESCELNTQDENDVAVNSEEEALLGPNVVSTSENCCESPEFFLCGQDSNKMEIPAVVNIVAVSTKPNYPEPVESRTHALDHEGSTGDETSNVHLPGQMSQEALVDPLVVDSFVDLFATSKLLSHSEAFKMTEVPGEDLSEILDEGASNHQNDGTIFSEYGGNTDNIIGDSMSVQLSAESNILEAHQGGQEAWSDPIHDSSSHSAGIFLSSSEVSDDEAFSSNSNSIFVCADSMEDKAPLSVQGGPSESKDEMNFAFLDTPISLNEVTSAESWTDNAECSQYIRDNAITKSLHDGNQVPLKTSEISNFGLEESLVSSEEGIKSEIFSLYSRSSSCVSEVNIIETLSGVAFPEPKNDNHFKSDQQNPTMALNMFHSDSCTKSAEFIADIDMVEALSGGNYSRSSLSMLDENLIEILGAVQEASFELNHEYPSSFEETSLYGNPSYNPMPLSHASMKVSVRSYGGLPNDEIAVDELSNKLLHENEVQAEINYTKTEYCSEALNLDSAEASESVTEGLFNPEHQGRPELVLSQVGMPFFIDDCKETEEHRGKSNADASHHEISILETPQELPVAAGAEKGLLKDSNMCESNCTNKEPKDFGKKKDSGINGNDDNTEDLDEDHKSTPINLLETA